jgi:hypothetical protein
MIISSQSSHSGLTAGADRAMKRYGQLRVFESMKTAARASLTTTGATNDHTVRRAWGRGTSQTPPTGCRQLRARTVTDDPLAR